MRNVVIALFAVCIFCVNSVQAQDCEYVHKGIKYYEKRVYSDNSEQNICDYYNLAREYYKKNKIQKALNTYADIIEINNQEEEAYVSRAVIYNLYNNPELSNQEWVRLLKNMPDSVVGNEGISEVYKSILDYDNALKYINIAIQKNNKKDSYLLYKRGEILRKQGKYEEAIKDYTRFISSEDFNDFYLVYDDRSECYKALGMEDKAKSDEDKYENYLSNTKINIFENIRNKILLNKLKKYTGELY